MHSICFLLKNTSKVSIDKAKYIEYNDIKGTGKEGNMTIKKLAKRLEEELDELEYIYGIMDGILHDFSIQLKRSQATLNDLKIEIEESEDD